MVKDASRPFFDSITKSKRLAIISDVHGNLDALQAVMKDAKEEGASAFLNAGASLVLAPTLKRWFP